MKIIVFIIVVVFCGNYQYAQNVLINEVMTSNYDSYADEDGDYSDWIELLNTTSDTINLLGFALTDNENKLSKWEFPDTVILPNQYLIVFASGKDKSVLGNILHTNFSLKSSGEEVFLTNVDTIYYSVSAENMNNNESYGLFPNGAIDFVKFNDATPGFSNDLTQSTNVIYSHKGGFYPGYFHLELTTLQSNQNIFYTIDGTEPTNLSFEYTAPLFLDTAFISSANINQMPITPDASFFQPEIEDVPKTIVIRAATFDFAGNQISSVVTNSYFIAETGMHTPEIPVMSICGNHDDFFDYDSGILVPGVHFNSSNPDWSGNYYQTGNTWEKEINIEYFENENEYVNQTCGIRIHGGNSRRGSQKAFKFYARNEYDNNNFSHRFFDDKEIFDFKRLVVKPFTSSWSQAGIEDYMSKTYAQNLEVDYGDSGPVVLYINGEYWGIYFLQEKIDEKFIEDNYSSINEECVEIVEDWKEIKVNGNGLSLYDYIEFHDLSNNDYYNYVSERIDISNFIDYQLLEIFIANFDWPANNMKCWKSSCYDDKWRWIMFDGDASMQNYNFDGFAQSTSISEDEWPSNYTSTMFLRKLLKNKSFNLAFFDRLEELLNNQFKSSHLFEKHHSLISDLSEEIGMQIKRFSYPLSISHWHVDINILRDFMHIRPCIVSEQVLEKYGLNYRITECSDNCSSLSNMKIFPNPTVGDFTVSIDADDAMQIEIKCADMTGKIIFLNSAVLIPGTNSIDQLYLNNLPVGIYVISIISESCNSNSKLIITDR